MFTSPDSRQYKIGDFKAVNFRTTPALVFIMGLAPLLSSNGRWSSQKIGPLLQTICPSVLYSEHRLTIAVLASNSAYSHNNSDFDTVWSRVAANYRHRVGPLSLTVSQRFGGERTTHYSSNSQCNASPHGPRVEVIIFYAGSPLSSFASTASMKWHWLLGEVEPHFDHDSFTAYNQDELEELFRDGVPCLPDMPDSPSYRLPQVAVFFGGRRLPRAYHIRRPRQAPEQEAGN